MAFTNNERFQQFTKELNARGVTYHWMWDARRDGKTPKYSAGRPSDIGMIAFTGNDFQPSILVAVVIDYGDKNGFGLFTDSPTLSIAADADAIATPNKAAA